MTFPITLTRIDTYGPWTASPEPRPESDIQAFQARLCPDFVTSVGGLSGYTFFTRFDNVIGFTNGLDFDDTARTQDRIRDRYPITVSTSVNTARTPEEAVWIATADLQDAGSARDEPRRSILPGESVDEDERRPEDVAIAHLDVVETTRKYTDELAAFDSPLRIVPGYFSLTEYLYENHASLTFFAGSDNTVAISPIPCRKGYRAATEHEESVGTPLQVAIGQARPTHQAGMPATHALETCRQNEARVEEPAAKYHGGESNR